MKCPNNDECIIAFYAEEYDNGDSSTPYFSSWTAWIYDPVESEHIPKCPPLTQEQIDKLEDKMNANPYNNLPEPYVDLD